LAIARRSVAGAHPSGEDTAGSRDEVVGHDAWMFG
jgi:hypothetical protein